MKKKPLCNKCGKKACTDGVHRFVNDYYDVLNKVGCHLEIEHKLTGADLCHKCLRELLWTADDA